MDTQAFKTCATVRFPSAARLLPSSWCPDKDLVIVVTNVAGKDRLALWPREGGRKMWEVDIEEAEVADIAWSPDGLHIAVAQNPPSIALHSLQDGRQLKIVPVYGLASGKDHRFLSLWWFRECRPETKEDIPDIFKRRGDITGSAHSILKSQPLLDALHDDSQPLSASELFAFQKSTQSRPASKSPMPFIIFAWPTLPSDPIAASVQSAAASGQQLRPGEELDETDDSSVNSILVATDDLGHIYHFLDGNYPLGISTMGKECTTLSMYRNHNPRYFFVHPQWGPSDTQQTLLNPAILDLRLFAMPGMVRDVARVSSSFRELTWYCMRVVKEMHQTWFGAEGGHGAREIGPRWVRVVESRQRQKYGAEDPNAMLDLTVLLTTGRASECLADFLGSGEQMTERNITKWETTMTETLIKLRDYSSKRVAPACQRMHVLLQEVLAWSKLAKYTLFEFREADIQAFLDITGRAIICANWLAATARRELTRFKEFIAWLRYEVFRASNSNPDTHSQTAKHDLLEVNEYFMSGLVVSSIDKWFMGPLPQFTPADLGVPGVEDWASSVQVVRDILDRPEGLTWPPPSHHQDLSRLDRNLVSLMQELSSRCYTAFNDAANAASRSAVIAYRPGRAAFEKIGAKHDAPLFVRERTEDDANEPNCFKQHLAIGMPHGGDNILCLVKMHHDKRKFNREGPVSVAVLQCNVASGSQEGMASVELLDAEFFDDTVLVIVYRPRQRDHGPTSIATVNYADLVYEDIATLGSIDTREAVMESTLQRLKDGQISSVPLPLIQSRALIGCREGGVTLAVNGRVGRRVACVLDDAGLMLEILDIESPDEDDGEEMQEA